MAKSNKPMVWSLFAAGGTLAALLAPVLVLAKRYEKALSRFSVIPVSPSIAVLAAQLRTQYRLKLPDAIQLASALDVGAAAFVTHERDFSQVTGVAILTGDHHG
jgi:predicted nucleic acid-binding protein